MSEKISLDSSVLIGLFLMKYVKYIERIKQFGISLCDSFSRTNLYGKVFSPFNELPSFSALFQFLL